MDKKTPESRKPWLFGHFEGEYLGEIGSGSLKKNNIFTLHIVRGALTNVSTSIERPNIPESEDTLEYDEIANVYTTSDNVKFGDQAPTKWELYEKLYQIRLVNYTIEPQHYSHGDGEVRGIIKGVMIANIYRTSSYSTSNSEPTSTVSSSSEDSKSSPIPTVASLRENPGCFGTREHFTKRLSILALMSTLNYNSLDVLSLFNFHFFPLPIASMPSEIVDIDVDGDGIVDIRDECIYEPEDFDGFEDGDGCPESDNDQDGFPDIIDKCINIPGTDDGCPTEKDDTQTVVDTDQDGFPDDRDKCPNEPETFNNFNDIDGCPDTPPEEWAMLLGDHAIGFETQTAKIQPSGLSTMNMILKILQENPKGQILITGHTDSRGTMQYNQRLSQQRARAVADWLIEQGIGKSRLQTRGVGYLQPKATNETSEGRALNRRVEFDCLICEEKPAELPPVDAQPSVTPDVQTPEPSPTDTP